MAQHQEQPLSSQPPSLSRAYQPSAPAPAAAAKAKTLDEIQTWKRISIGNYRNPNALRAALDAANMHIGDSADEILGRPGFSFSRTEIDLDLVILSGADLGFAGHAALADIYRRAVQLGLELCPPEAGPQLRLQYRNQPVGEFLHMAMSPLATYHGALVDLTVGNGGAGLILIGGEGNPDLKLHASVKFVFVRPARVALPNMNDDLVR
jgi:hypothetical protein